MAKDLSILEKMKLAIHRRLNLINGEFLTCDELMEETNGMANEINDIFLSIPAPKFKAGDFITDGKSKVTVTKILSDGYEIESEEIDACESYPGTKWTIKFEDENKWATVESEDVLEEMNNYFEKMDLHENEYIFEDTFQKIARHFIEYGKKHANVSVENEIDWPKGLTGPEWWKK